MARNQSVHKRLGLLRLARLMNVRHIRLRGFAKQSDCRRVRRVAAGSVDEKTVLQLDLVQHETGWNGVKVARRTDWAAHGRMSRSQGGVPMESPCVRDRPCRLDRAGVVCGKTKQSTSLPLFNSLKFLKGLLFFYSIKQHNLSKFTSFISSFLDIKLKLSILNFKLRLPLIY